jgi:UDP-N-acetylmuramate dehydrogenase
MKLEQIERHRLLNGLTTFGIGGEANYFIEVRSIEAMQQALRLCAEQQIPFFILGKGSNTLFDDRGFAGMVIANRIDFIEEIKPACWKVGAGYSFSLLGTQTARQGYGGLEFASGIPGSVGGAVFMNAGANGSETAETVESVEFVRPDGSLVTLTREEIVFDYRFSSFQAMPGAIASAQFQLTPQTGSREKQLSIISYRKETQPYNAKSAGCVFRNPPANVAGKLIDECGLKGFSIGGAEVSALHGNFVINTGKATASEVKALIQEIRKRVKELTGVELESEIRCIPFNPLEAGCHDT